LLLLTKHTKMYKQSGKRKREREGERGTHIYWTRRKSGEHRRRRRRLLLEGRRTRRRGRRLPWAEVDCSSCHRILDRSSRRRILEQIGRRLHGELVPPPAMEEWKVWCVALASSCG
jgi:hypothetical protein